MLLNCPCLHTQLLTILMHVVPLQGSAAKKETSLYDPSGDDQRADKALKACAASISSATDDMNTDMMQKSPLRWSTTPTQLHLCLCISWQQV